MTSFPLLGDRVAEMHRRLRAAGSAGAVLAVCANEARDALGFDRAVVADVQETCVSATVTHPLGHDQSDALRLACIANPLATVTSSLEAELIRRADLSASSAPSELARRHELEQWVIVPIVPESTVIALLVLDRAEPPITEIDRAQARWLAQLFSLHIERVILRTRVRELSADLRQLTVTAQALSQEALEAPVVFPTDYGHGDVFLPSDPVAHRNSELRELLTARERQIMRLLVEGRSNREIGEALHLSTETVKGYVKAMLRKLGASNRVELVARFLEGRDSN